jgi:hypothetical protein
MIATRQDFFKPEKLSSDAKAAQPESSVRSILEAETAARDKKPQSLRTLRLARTAAGLSHVSGNIEPHRG